MWQEKIKVHPPEFPSVSIAVCRVKKSSSGDDIDALDKLIETSPDLYTLKKRFKRFGYLLAFVEFFVARSKGLSFCKPNMNATFLDRGFVKAIVYVQKRHFGDVIEPLRENSLDDFEAVLKRVGAGSNGNTRRVHELKTLRNLRPCVGSDLLLRVDGRLENAELPTDQGCKSLLKK